MGREFAMKRDRGVANQVSIVLVGERDRDFHRITPGSYKAIYDTWYRCYVCSTSGEAYILPGKHTSAAISVDYLQLHNQTMVRENSTSPLIVFFHSHDNLHPIRILKKSETRSTLYQYKPRWRQNECFSFFVSFFCGARKSALFVCTFSRCLLCLQK